MNERYVEVVIEGSIDLMKGFVAGFLEGRGVEGDVFFGEGYHIEGESPVGLLLRLTGIRGETSTVIVGAGLHDLLAAALEKRQRVVPLHIRKGWQGNRVSNCMKPLFLKAKGSRPTPPLHDYELNGKGRISGSVKGVFGVYHQMGRFEVAELGEMGLTYGEPS